MTDRYPNQPSQFNPSNQGPGLNLEHDLNLGRGDFWQRQTWPPGDYGTGGGGFEFQGPPRSQGQSGGRGQGGAQGTRMQATQPGQSPNPSQGQRRPQAGMNQGQPRSNQQQAQGGNADWGTQPYYGGYGYDFRGQGFGGMAQGYPNRGFGNPNQTAPGLNQRPSWQQGPHAGKGPKRADNRIQDEVAQRLTQHGHLDASDIEVTVDNGAVTLTGTVDSRQAKREAERVADAVPGVQDVHNQLTVQQGQGQNPTVH